MIRRIISGGTAALMLAAGLLLAGPASTAHATAAECSNGANGFTDISDSLRGTPVNGTAVTNSNGNAASFGQHVGTVSGRQMGWGFLEARNLPSSVRVDLWMDVTNDGGNTWIQCGPFSMWGSGTITTAAYPTSSSSLRKFRVCASITGPGGGPQCLNWW
ncbi:hypothetical protein [Streptomyces macrosporus]